MKAKEKLIKGINKSQMNIDLLIQKLNQARQRLAETRIKVDNDQLKPGKLSEILDEIITSIFPKLNKKFRILLRAYMAHKRR